MTIVGSLASRPRLAPLPALGRAATVSPAEIAGFSAVNGAVTVAVDGTVPLKPVDALPTGRTLSPGTSLMPAVARPEGPTESC